MHHLQMRAKNFTLCLWGNEKANIFSMKFVFLTQNDRNMTLVEILIVTAEIIDFFYCIQIS